MDICGGFHDGNVHGLLESRYIDARHDANRCLQMHSSLVRRLSREKELEGHKGCVNAIAWNSSGSLLISGSDDTRINIWSYSGRKLLHSIDTGHSANIFCTKFVPETSDELVVSGAGDAEVRLFNLSRLDGRGTEENAIPPSALFQCHTRRVKKLAVEVGNPNVVWSASEDGTLRQHDFREGNSCPPAGSPQQECRSVLLDLRSGSKKSLTDPPKGLLALKSCDISSTRPHLILVGGSDAFARLYDRRMLPPLTSCRKRMAPPPCVNYFCPMHLSDRGRSSLHLTHVTFSPNGEEVLLSYSGEHVYLMNVNPVGGNVMKYTAADVSKLTTFTSWPNGVELRPTISKNYAHHLADSQLEKCQSLMQFAEASLKEGTDYYYGIEACNEVLDGHRQVIEPALRLECLCTRAALLLKRKWKNDVHMAIRDCQSARMIDTSSVRPLYYLSEALSQLGKHKEALDFALSAQRLSPSDTKLEERVQDIKQRLAAAEAEKNNKVTNGAPRSEPRGAKVLSLGDILFRSEANSDASQDGPRSEREESDYDEEMEVDFETSISGDEGRDVESNVLHGSLNLRIHRRSDSSRENASTNDSCGSPSSSSQNDKIPYQVRLLRDVVPVFVVPKRPHFCCYIDLCFQIDKQEQDLHIKTELLSEAVIDMKQRYVGHCNVGTDIKQASFLGQRGEYVASGSDDGRWFIWEKRTGRLIKMLLGDEAVVNCVQCHPFDCVVATSGIDNTIKIWTPSAPASSVVAGVVAGPENANVLDTMENNERRLIHNREIILPFEILERFRMHESAECAQS